MAAEQRTPQVGDLVIWHDSVGNPHNALVQCVWSATCLNLLFISPDEARQDSFGRQFERQTSASHKSHMNVHGFYWRFPDEEPNPYVPPVEK